MELSFIKHRWPKQYAYVKHEFSLGIADGLEMNQTKGACLLDEIVWDPIKHKTKRSLEQEWAFNECVKLMLFLGTKWKETSG
ncbi:hypothetical protein BELL_1056g00030 [Botrytis elliptica]|uniref:Uncharacterized protein n=1 Tax=Botrytis elliptica TaxID=278938 RepID=A0A4Z1IXD7_9HELO|nr:hypothetical protein BELL_1056g00030 [Botrytis elliptica]